MLSMLSMLSKPVHHVEYASGSMGVVKQGWGARLSDVHLMCIMWMRSNWSYRYCLQYNITRSCNLSFFG